MLVLLPSTIKVKFNKQSPEFSWEFPSGLVVNLRLGAFTAMGPVQFLLRKPISCKLHGEAKKEEGDRVFSMAYKALLIWPMLIGKDSDAGRDWGQEEKGTTEDEMAGWHHWLDGLESEWTLGVGDGQGDLACWDSWGCKESDMTERLNWTELNTSETC